MKKTYFFYRRDYHDSFYDVVIESWIGEPTFYVGEGIHRESFTLLEKLKIHACKNHSHSNKRKKFHCLTFEHRKGLDLCEGISAKSEREFLKIQVNSVYYPMEQISKSDFLRFRKAILSIYKNYPDIDYEQIIEMD